MTTWWLPCDQILLLFAKVVNYKINGRYMYSRILSASSIPDALPYCRMSLVRPAAAFCKLHRRISPKIIWPLPQAQHVMPKSCKESKGMSGWVLIGVVSGNKHACKVTSHLQFVKGLVGVRVLQLFELKKLERSPRHFQLPPPSASVYLRIVLFTSDVITLLLCTAGPWHCAF